MKSGLLYGEANQVLGKIRGAFVGMEKRVYRGDGSLALKTDVRELDASQRKRSDVRCHAYGMQDPEGREIAVARPGYADGEDPAVGGWPLCRMPRVDHAAVEIQGRAYELVMHNSQNYTLRDESGYTAVQILHRGLAGGWNIDAQETLAPEILCGVFIFCRYIEQENELMVV